MEKRQLLLGNLVLILLFVPSLCFGASFVSCATGNWTNQNTWNVDGAGCGVTASHPDSGDTVTIINGNSVTVEESHNLGTCTVEGMLILATGVTATLNGTLTLGNGSSKEGWLYLGAGSTLAMGSNNVAENNFGLRSNATSTNWANVTGSGNWTGGGVYPGPNNVKQDIDIQYVSFQTTGSIQFYIGSGGTIVTNQFKAKNCVFYGTNGLNIGFGSYTATSTPIQFEDCDFREFVSSTKIYIEGITGNNNLWFKRCTFYKSSSPAFGLNVMLSSVIIEDCVFANWIVYNGLTPSANTTIITMRRNAFLFSGMAAGSSTVNLSAGGTSCFTFEDNYVLSDYGNSHALSYQSTDAGSACLYSRNVLEWVPQGDRSEIWAGSGDNNFNYYNNVLIDHVAKSTAGTSHYGKTYNFHNNTSWMTQSDFEGAIFLASKGPCDDGGGGAVCTFNIRNNIVSGNVSIPAAVNDTDMHYHITTCSWTGGTATCNTTVHYLDSTTTTKATITGVSPSGYNVSGVQVTRVDSDTFSYPVAVDPGGAGSGGTLDLMQYIAVSDYNVFYNVTAPYDEVYITISSGKTNDLNSTDPKFIDSSRKFVKWNARFGSGTESISDGITYALGINGYRGSPNYDQQGTKSYKPSTLVDFVRYGFSPTNPLLRKSGHDGSTRGAVEWQNPRRARIN